MNDKKTSHPIKDSKSNEKTPIYQTMGAMEESYSTTRYRVFVGSNN